MAVNRDLYQLTATTECCGKSTSASQEASGSTSYTFHLQAPWKHECSGHMYLDATVLACKTATSTTACKPFRLANTHSISPIHGWKGANRHLPLQFHHHNCHPPVPTKQGRETTGSLTQLLRYDASISEQPSTADNKASKQVEQPQDRATSGIASVVCSSAFAATRMPQHPRSSITALLCTGLTAAAAMAAQMHHTIILHVATFPLARSQDPSPEEADRLIQIASQGIDQQALEQEPNWGQFQEPPQPDMPTQYLTFAMNYHDLDTDGYDAVYDVLESLWGIGTPLLRRLHNTPHWDLRAQAVSVVLLTHRWWDIPFWSQQKILYVTAAMEMDERDCLMQHLHSVLVELQVNPETQQQMIRAVLNQLLDIDRVRMGEHGPRRVTAQDSTVLANSYNQGTLEEWMHRCTPLQLWYQMRGAYLEDASEWDPDRLTQCTVMAERVLAQLDPGLHTGAIVLILEWMTGQEGHLIQRFVAWFDSVTSQQVRTMAERVACTFADMSTDDYETEVNNIIDQIQQAMHRVRLTTNHEAWQPLQAIHVASHFAIPDATPAASSSAAALPAMSSTDVWQSMSQASGSGDTNDTSHEAWGQSPLGGIASPPAQTYSRTRYRPTSPRSRVQQQRWQIHVDALIAERITSVQFHHPGTVHECRSVTAMQRCLQEQFHGIDRNERITWDELPALATFITALHCQRWDSLYQAFAADFAALTQSQLTALARIATSTLPDEQQEDQFLVLVMHAEHARATTPTRPSARGQPLQLLRAAEDDHDTHWLMQQNMPVSYGPDHPFPQGQPALQATQTQSSTQENVEDHTAATNTQPAQEENIPQIYDTLLREFHIDAHGNLQQAIQIWPSMQVILQELAAQNSLHFMHEAFALLLLGEEPQDLPESTFEQIIQRLAYATPAVIARLFHCLRTAKHGHRDHHMTAILHWCQLQRILREDTMHRNDPQYGIPNVDLLAHRLRAMLREFHDLPLTRLQHIYPGAPARAVWTEAFLQTYRPCNVEFQGYTCHSQQHLIQTIVENLQEPELCAVAALIIIEITTPQQHESGLDSFAPVIATFSLDAVQNILRSVRALFSHLWPADTQAAFYTAALDRIEIRMMQFRQWILFGKDLDHPTPEDTTGAYDQTPSDNGAGSSTDHHHARSGQQGQDTGAKDKQQRPELENDMTALMQVHPLQQKQARSRSPVPPPNFQHGGGSSSSCYPPPPQPIQPPEEGQVCSTCHLGRTSSQPLSKCWQCQRPCHTGCLLHCTCGIASYENMAEWDEDPEVSAQVLVDNILQFCAMALDDTIGLPPHRYNIPAMLHSVCSTAYNLIDTIFPGDGPGTVFEEACQNLAVHLQQLLDTQIGPAPPYAQHTQDPLPDLGRTHHPGHANGHMSILRDAFAAWRSRLQHIQTLPRPKQCAACERVLPNCQGTGEITCPGCGAPYHFSCIQRCPCMPQSNRGHPYNCAVLYNTIRAMEETIHPEEQELVQQSFDKQDLTSDSLQALIQVLQCAMEQDLEVPTIEYACLPIHLARRLLAYITQNEDDLIFINGNQAQHQQTKIRNIRRRRMLVLLSELLDWHPSPRLARALSPLTCDACEGMHGHYSPLSTCHRCRLTNLHQHCQAHCPRCFDQPATTYAAFEANRQLRRTPLLDPVISCPMQSDGSPPGTTIDGREVVLGPGGTMLILHPVSGQPTWIYGTLLSRPHNTPKAWHHVGGGQSQIFPTYRCAQCMDLRTMRNWNLGNAYCLTCLRGQPGEQTAMLRWVPLHVSPTCTIWIIRAMTDRQVHLQLQPRWTRNPYEAIGYNAMWNPTATHPWPVRTHLLDPDTDDASLPDTPPEKLPPPSGERANAGPSILLWLCCAAFTYSHFAGTFEATEQTRKKKASTRSPKSCKRTLGKPLLLCLVCLAAIRCEAVQERTSASEHQDIAAHESDTTELVQRWQKSKTRQTEEPEQSQEINDHAPGIPTHAESDEQLPIPCSMQPNHQVGGATSSTDLAPTTSDEPHYNGDREHAERRWPPPPPVRQQQTAVSPPTALILHAGGHHLDPVWLVQRLDALLYEYICTQAETQWTTPGTGGDFPSRVTISWPLGAVQEGARLDFQRPGSDRLNTWWAQIYQQLHRTRAFLQAHKTLTNTESQANFIEFTVGLCFAVADAGRSLRAGNRITLTKAQHSGLLAAAWAVMEKLGLQPEVIQDQHSPLWPPQVAIAALQPCNTPDISGATLKHCSAAEVPSSPLMGATYNSWLTLPLPDADPCAACRRCPWSGTSQCHICSHFFCIDCLMQTQPNLCYGCRGLVLVVQPQQEEEPLPTDHPPENTEQSDPADSSHTATANGNEAGDAPENQDSILQGSETTWPALPTGTEGESTNQGEEEEDEFHSLMQRATPALVHALLTAPSGHETSENSGASSSHEHPNRPSRPHRQPRPQQSGCCAACGVAPSARHLAQQCECGRTIHMTCLLQCPCQETPEAFGLNVDVTPPFTRGSRGRRMKEYVARLYQLLSCEGDHHHNAKLIRTILADVMLSMTRTLTNPAVGDVAVADLLDHIQEMGIVNLIPTNQQSLVSPQDSCSLRCAACGIEQGTYNAAAVKCIGCGRILHARCLAICPCIQGDQHGHRIIPEDRHPQCHICHQPADRSNILQQCTGCQEQVHLTCQHQCPRTAPTWVIATASASERQKAYNDRHEQWPPTTGLVDEEEESYVATTEVTAQSPATGHSDPPSPSDASSILHTTDTEMMPQYSADDEDDTPPTQQYAPNSIPCPACGDLLEQEQGGYLSHTTPCALCGAQIHIHCVFQCPCVRELDHRTRYHRGPPLQLRPLIAETFKIALCQITSRDTLQTKRHHPEILLVVQSLWQSLFTRQTTMTTQQLRADLEFLNVAVNQSLSCCDQCVMCHGEATEQDPVILCLGCMHPMHLLCSRDCTLWPCCCIDIVPSIRRTPRGPPRHCRASPPPYEYSTNALGQDMPMQPSHDSHEQDDEDTEEAALMQITAAYPTAPNSATDSHRTDKHHDAYEEPSEPHPSYAKSCQGTDPTGAPGPARRWGWLTAAGNGPLRFLQQHTTSCMLVILSMIFAVEVNYRLACRELHLAKQHAAEAAKLQASNRKSWNNSVKPIHPRPGRNDTRRQIRGRRNSRHVGLLVGLLQCMQGQSMYVEPNVNHSAIVTPMDGITNNTYLSDPLPYMQHGCLQRTHPTFPRPGKNVSFGEERVRVFDPSRPATIIKRLPERVQRVPHLAYLHAKQDLTQWTTATDSEKHKLVRPSSEEQDPCSHDLQPLIQVLQGHEGQEADHGEKLACSLFEDLHQHWSQLQQDGLTDGYAEEALRADINSIATRLMQDFWQNDCISALTHLRNEGIGHICEEFRDPLLRKVLEEVTATLLREIQSEVETPPQFEAADSQSVPAVKRISLAEALQSTIKPPAVSENQDIRRLDIVQLGVTDATVELFTAPWYPGPTVDLQSIQEIHPFSQMALEMSQYIPDHYRKTAVHLYPDGSAGHHKVDNDEIEQRAAWAVAVISEWAPQMPSAAAAVQLESLYKFEGYYAGEVVTDCQDNRWIGATQLNSLHAEASGTMTAIQIAMQSMDDKQMPYWIHYDCNAVGQCASGDANWTDDSHLPELLRALALAAQAIRPTFFAWIKGHSGHPWNELADCIAKARCLLQIEDTMPGWPLHEALQAHTVQQLKWLWAQIKRHEQPELPFIDEHGQMYVTQAPADPNMSKAELLPAMQDQISVPGEICSIHLQTASINVLTLGQGHMNHKSLSEDDMLRAGISQEPIADRTTVLQKEFHDAGYHVVGLQETRSKKEGTQNCNGWLVISAAAGKRSQSGCQLWLNTNKSYGVSGKDTKLFIDAQQIVVKHHEPTCLIVGIDAPGLSVDYVVAHAPHSGKHKHTISAWWRKLQRTLLDRPNHQPLHIFIDANATLGEEVIGDLVQTAGAEKSNPVTTEYLVEFLQTLELSVPATFEINNHGGQHHTWEHPKHGKCRIDYQLIPQDRLHTVDSCYVDTIVAVDLKRRDHYPAAVVSQWQTEAGNHTRHTFQRNEFNTRRMKKGTPEQVQSSEYLRAALQVGTLPWSMDVHRHYAQLQQWSRRIAEWWFPKQSNAKRQGYIGDETWEVVKWRRQLRRSFRACTNKARRPWLRAAFRAWARTSYFLLNNCGTEEMLTSLRRMAMHHSCTSRIGNRITEMVKHDKAAMLESISKKVEQQAEYNQMGDLLRTIKCFRIGAGAPKRRPMHKVKPLPKLNDDKGQVIGSFTGIRERWQQHFGNMEAGSVSQVEHAATAHIHRQNGALMQRPAPRMEHLPTLQDVEWSIRIRKTRRAAGPDDIPAELYKSDVQAFASVIYPVALKVSSQVSAAFGMLGGLVVEFYKGKGPQAECSSYRSILLTDELSKIIRKPARDKLLPAYHEYHHEIQLGGLKHQSCDFAVHLMQEFQAYVKTRRRSGAALFVDVVSAYYRVVRGLCYQAIEADDDEAIAAVLHAVGLPPSALQELIALLHSEANALQDAQVDSHLMSVTATMNGSTWFATQGLGDICCTKTGTRPGDVYADILFNYVLAGALKQIEDQLDAENLIIQIPWSGTPGFGGSEQGLKTHMAKCLGAGWADDLMFLFEGETPEILDDNLSRGAAIVHNCLQVKGMKLNMAKNKTAAMVFYNGAHADKARDRLFHDASLVIPLSTAYEEESVQLPVCLGYEYLGTHKDYKGRMMKEIRRRMCSATCSLRPLRPRVFKNPSLPGKAKHGVGQALAFSTGLYCSATWPSLNKKEFDQYAKGVMKCYRIISSNEYADHQTHITDQEVLDQTGFPSPEEVLRVQRLAYSGRLFEHGPPALHALLQQNYPAQQSWGRMVQEDLQWMRQQLPKGGEMSCPRSDMDAWTAAMQESGKWKKQVVTAKQCAHEKRQLQSQVYDGHKKFVRLAEEAGLHIETGPLQQEVMGRQVATKRASGAQGTWTCPVCQAVKSTKTAMRSHMASQHKWRSPLQYYLGSDNTCRACGNQYANRSAAMMHLRYADREDSKLTCTEDLTTALQPFAMEDTHNLMAIEAKRLQEAKASGGSKDEDSLPCTKSRKLGPWLRGAAAAHRNRAQDPSGEIPANQINTGGRPKLANTDASEDLKFSLFEDLHTCCEGLMHNELADQTTRDQMQAEIQHALQDLLDGVQHSDCIIALQHFCEESIDLICAEFVDPMLREVLEDTASTILEDMQCREDPYDGQGAGAGHGDNAAGSVEPLQRKAPTTTRARALLGNPYVENNGSQGTFMLCDPEQHLSYRGENDQLLDLQHYKIMAARIAVDGMAQIDCYTQHMAPTRVFLNLCSGRRREGDIQWHIDLLSQQYQDIDVMVLSIDLAVHETRCDLTSAKAVQFWDDQCCKGRVAGVGIGPPCETWTKLRFLHDMEGQDKLPPPLRSRLMTWGLEGLTRKQYKQLILSNQLLFVGFHFLLLMAQCGGLGFLEHPEKPTGIPQAPSIWFLSYVKWLLDIPGMISKAFTQDVHGQISVKPTRMLFLRMPSVVKYLYRPQEEVAKTKDLAPLMGKNTDGSFRSAQAKEYPSSLCKALAKGILDSLSAKLTPGSAEEKETAAGSLYETNGEGNSGPSVVWNPWREYSEFHCALDRYDPESEVHGQQISTDCKLHRSSGKSGGRS